MGSLLGQMVHPDGADQMIVYEDAKTMAIGRVVKVIVQQLFVFAGNDIVGAIGLVSEPVDCLDIFAGFAPAVFRPVQVLHDLTIEPAAHGFCSMDGW